MIFAHTAKERTVAAMTNEEAAVWFEARLKNIAMPGAREMHKMAISALQAWEWISVDDRLPDESYPVLCVTSAGGMMIARYGHKYGSWHVSGSIDITHWMPLPEPPEVKK